MDFSRKTLNFYGHQEGIFICEGAKGRYELLCTTGQGIYHLKWEQFGFYIIGQYHWDKKHWSIGVMPNAFENLPDWIIRWRGTKKNSPIGEIIVPQKAMIIANGVNTEL